MLLLLQWQHRDLPNSLERVLIVKSQPQRKWSAVNKLINQTDLLLHALSMCRFRFRSQFQFHLWVLALGFNFAWCLSMLVISYLAVGFSLSFRLFHFYATLAPSATLAESLSPAHTINTWHFYGNWPKSRRVVASSRWQDLPFVFRIISDAHRPHQLNSSPTHRLTDSRLCRWPKLSPHSTRQQCSTFNIRLNNTVQQVFFLATSLLVIKIM